MALAGFGNLPVGIPGVPVPFQFHVPDNDIQHMDSLAGTAAIGVPSWYNTHDDNNQFGVSRDWLINASSTWQHDFDWRAHENHYNSFPNFKINITTSDHELHDLHFAALFSAKPDAIPVIFMHGWPGSWLEFVPMLDLLVAKYTPATLPYHVIVPSIPDYGLSERVDPADELTMAIASEAMNSLMKALGFKSYVAQGGDVGSILAQTMCGVYDECKAFHLNLYFLTANQTAQVANISVTAAEEAEIASGNAWAKTGSAYAYEHGTRPSTIALALMANPLSMLAWMGEKFIEWTDPRAPLSLDTILAMVSFYWYTESFGRAIWSYRALTNVIGAGLPPAPTSYVKPFGFSSFPVEISALPKEWAEAIFPNLVFYKSHDVGGHFAALEEPVAFLSDMEEFLAIVKTKVAF